MAKKKIFFIDFARGIALILMVAYHTWYDLYYMFEVDTHIPLYLAKALQIGASYGFIIINGICINFSTNLVRSALKLSLAALVITVGTYIFLPEFVIYFGILHFFALASIVYFLFRGLFEKINNVGGLTFSITIFALMKSDFFKNSRLNFYIKNILTPLPFGFLLGYPKGGFTSSDYYPLFPWIFLSLSGYYLGKLILEGHINLPKIKNNKNPIVVLGQNTLPIYMIHQVVIYSFIYIIVEIMVRS